MVHGDGVSPVLEGLVQLEGKKIQFLRLDTEQGEVLERNVVVLLTQTTTARSTSAWVSAALTASTAKETR